MAGRKSKTDIRKKELEGDLQDSYRDQQRLKPDKATLDLPEVKDIPGQEHIHVPPLGDLADVTASSADEEGKGVLDEVPITRKDNDADVTEEEKELLQASAEFTPEEEEINLRRALPDNKDADGDPLNESIDLSGEELDVPGADLDDTDEEIGEEDEENNPYSVPDQEEDRS